MLIFTGQGKKKEDLVLFTTNVRENVPDPTKAKQHYELLFKNKGKNK